MKFLHIGRSTFGCFKCRKPTSFYQYILSFIYFYFYRIPRTWASAIKYKLRLIVDFKTIITKNVVKISIVLRKINVSTNLLRKSNHKLSHTDFFFLILRYIVFVNNFSFCKKYYKYSPPLTQAIKIIENFEIFFKK